MRLVLKEPAIIDSMISEHDLVVSLLPFTFHPSIAKLCIKHRKDMVTSSYVSPELQALDAESVYSNLISLFCFSAKAAGITVMNECGLDPGIDHVITAFNSWNNKVLDARDGVH